MVSSIWSRRLQRSRRAGGGTHGRGAGGFSSPTYYSTFGADCESVVVGDFNGDGISDLALGGSNTVIRLGDGHGGFPQAMTIGWATEGLETADFNHDGLSDLVVLTNGVTAANQCHGTGPRRVGLAQRRGV